MGTIEDVALLTFGGLILYLGAEWLVKGSAGLARAFGVKPLVIGLTVVAYGTSAPELAVSSSAVIKDADSLLVGAVIGSCIANLALILGITCLIAPPDVDGRLIRRELPVLITSVAAMPLILWDGEISRIEAVGLLAAAVVFTFYTLTVSTVGSHVSSAEHAEEGAEAGGAPPGTGQLRLWAITIVGLALLVGGGECFVKGAKSIATTLGMDESLIGLTVVAIGTSLPELAASVVAAMRGQSSLAIGNVIGSNIFNIFLILGVTGQIRPIKESLGNVELHVWFLVGTTILGVLLMRGARKISRWEGLMLLGVYVAFMTVSVVRGIS